MTLAKPASRSQETILIVEDDPGVQALQRKRLERAGYTVATANDAGDALKMVYNREVTLVLMDFRLPGTTGLELYRQIKATGVDVPVIMVTGFSEESTAIEALRAGVRDFVSKSMDYLEYLPEAVDRVLNQVRLEQKLREQATLLEKAQDAILVRDLEDRIVFWNQRAEQLYGWTAAEALGQSADELLYRDNCPELFEAHRALLEQGQWTGELRQVSKAGRDVIVESRWTLVCDDRGRPKSKLVVNTDVTEKKELAAQALHAQRMDSIGALAGSIAHEFNNLLQAISSYTSFASDALSEGHPAIDDLRQVQVASERAAILVRQLLGFGRRHQLAAQEIDSDEAILDLLKLLRPLIGENIEIETQLERGLGAITVDPALFQQVLMNLCVNARDAMPTGGRLTISTEQVQLAADGRTAHLNLGHGSYLHLTISDTGCGMSREVQERIFEPFFTTKEPGKGTGLGLAMVYGTLVQHGGTVHVESEPGAGTTFHLYLPILEGKAVQRERMHSASETRGSETVLVADDDPLVRSVAVRVLERAGYKVLAAADGEEALRLFEQHETEIQLAVLDVVMPKAGGHEVMAHLRERQPGIPIVFCSGYDPQTQDALPEEGVSLLQKPFEPPALAALVRQKIDERPCRI